jgi:hypothetical protein
MKKFFPVCLAVIMVLSMIFFAVSTTPVTARETKLLEFSGMSGVPRPYTGAANAIRGIPGGGLPWVISSADGELKVNGRLVVVVRGLLIDPNDPAAIAAGRAGTNPSSTFKATVSCLSKDSSGNAVMVNVSSAAFPADAMGNATIKDMLHLPMPCIAPIIFVGSPGGAWFASTGF